MSLYDYKQSEELTKGNPSFTALIMAAIRKADTMNLEALKFSFNIIYEEFKERYNAPGGKLEGEK